MNDHAGRVLSPEQIAQLPVQQAPFLRLPDPGSVFAQREARLRSLAAGHPMSAYLEFVAEIAAAQDHAARHAPAVEPPPAQQLAAAAMQREPPLAAASWRRSPAWRDALRELLVRLDQRLPQGAAREAVRRLSGASDAFVESQADRLLTSVTLGLDLGLAPLVAAGLQLYWSRLVAAAAAADGSVFVRLPSNTTCPCCGSRPTASVVRIGGAESGYRYLHCALCSSQWHMVRIKCAHCESTKGIHYDALDPLPGSDAVQQGGPARRAAAGAVKAECCDECGHYLKLLAMDKDPEIEPVADDLATVALDLLVTQSGKRPAGVNLMLLYGDPGDG